MELTSPNTIHMDIVEISGRTIESVKVLGMIPDDLTKEGETSRHGDFNIYIRWDGTVVRADRSSDDTMIVAASMRLGKVKAFHTLMQHLADHYGAPVTVALDPNVGPGGQAPKLTGTWYPSAVPTVEEQVTQAQATTETPGNVWTAEAIAVRQAEEAKVREQYRATVAITDVDGGDVESARVAVRDNPMGRIFVAECHNWAPKAAFDLLVESGTHMVIGEGDMAAYRRKPAQANTVTDADMRAQVTQALGADVDGFDVGWIVDCVQRQFGTVDIDTVPADDFWYMVRVHGSRDLRKGSATVARIAPAGSQGATDAHAYLKAVGSKVPLPSVARELIMSYLSTHDLPADRYSMSAAVRDLIGLGLPESEITGAMIADVLLFAVRPWDRAEAQIWAGTDTMIKRPIRALLNRRKRKATKVNARRVRGGF